MEHQILPKGVTSVNFQIPYVAEDYDGGPFLTYPQRRGRPELSMLDGTTQVAFRLQVLSNPMPTEEQQSLFQTWLFFGLLQSLCGKLFDAADYVRDDRTAGKVITTERLMPTIRSAFVAPLPATDAGSLQGEYARAVQCLQTVQNVLSLANEDFDWRIRLSITSVAELLSVAVNLSYWSHGATSEFQPPILFLPHFPPEEIRQHMLRNGWCPSEIATIKDKFSSLQTLMFLSQMDKSVAGQNHDGCTHTTCRSYQIDLSNYHTRHAEAGCTCEDWVFENATLISTLQRGSLPLLKVSGREATLSIECVDSGPEKPYVALSHVWANGLGNPRLNALPRCQLAKLGDYIRDIEGQGEQHASGPSLGSLHLWIDTLCCPVEPPEYKTLAISLLRKTYLEAAHVLVLDAGIQSVAEGEIEPHEALLRIETSAWTQRLWTLQEGVLAKRRWFQFRNGPVDIDSLNPRLEQDAKVDLRAFQLRGDIDSQKWWMKLRGFSGDESQPKKNADIGMDLYSLDGAFQHRSVSVPSDEPLCICTLMDLPVIKVLEGRSDVYSRMAKVWELIASKYGALPSAIIMLGFPKVDLEGFRWAPKTMLAESVNLPGSQLVSRGSRWSDSKLAKVTNHGLQMRAPGYLLKLDDKHPPPPPGAYPWLRLDSSFENLPITWRAGNQWCLVAIQKDRPLVVGETEVRDGIQGTQVSRALISQGNCAVLRVPGPSSEAEEGIVGTVEQLGDGGLKFTPKCYVTMMMIPEILAAPYSAPRQIAGQILDNAELRRCLEDKLDGTDEDRAAAIGKLDSAIERAVQGELQNPILAAMVQQFFFLSDPKQQETLMCLMVKFDIWYDFVGEPLGEEQVWYVT